MVGETPELKKSWGCPGRRGNVGQGGGGMTPPLQDDTMQIINSREAILTDIRQILGRNSNSPVAPRPAIVPTRVPGNQDEEVAKLLEEAAALGCHTARFAPSRGGVTPPSSGRVALPLGELVKKESVSKAVMWDTERLRQLGIADQLRALNVSIIPHDADKHVMAQADLGITEADYVLPETGTLGLLSSSVKPRSVSLLPRVHLAIIHRRALRADLHQVFAEAKAHPYLVLITGPSRTSDIELVVTIGVHGPQVLYIWVVED